MVKYKKIIPLSLIFCMTMTLLCIGVSPVHAASVSVTEYESARWVQGQNINSGLRLKTKSGEVAYCLNQGRGHPSGSFNDSKSITKNQKAVLYYGYPYNKKFGSISLTSDQSRCATQLALWAWDKSGKGNSLDLSGLHGAYDKQPDGDNVLKAAKWLYNKAKSGYSNPDIPKIQKPNIVMPSGDGTNINNLYGSAGNYYRSKGTIRVTNTKKNKDNGIYLNDFTMKLTHPSKVISPNSKSLSNSFIGDSNGRKMTRLSDNINYYIYISKSDVERLKLGTEGIINWKTNNATVNLSFSGKYSEGLNFEAYSGGSSRQDIAIVKKIEYIPIKQDVSGSGAMMFTTDTQRIKSGAMLDGTNRPLPDTNFNLYLDKTSGKTGRVPVSKYNGDWTLLYTGNTDKNGKLNLPALGTGKFCLVETKENPFHATSQESGESENRILNVGATGATGQVQVFTNDEIAIGCQVFKDTIKRTSAAYESLPMHEDYMNTNSDTYRYNIDYRSTSSVAAEEFVVDDPLECVKENHVRVKELWTPISYGDYDKKMNVWYKTNLTHDDRNYSDENAMETNEKFAHNPDNNAQYPNTGYKLWKDNVPTEGVGSRIKLDVADLGLEEDEYITALRFEHGEVLKGFTTRNTETTKLNDNSVSDWIPKPEDHFYTIQSANATDLSPATYTVFCPTQIDDMDKIIVNSATSRISRNNGVLTDQDQDNVETGVVNTFTVETDSYSAPNKVVKDKGDKIPVATKEDYAGINSNTGDDLDLNVLLIITLISIAALGIAFLIRKKKFKNITMILILCLILTSMIIPHQSADAETKNVDSFSYSYTTTKAIKIKSAENGGGKDQFPNSISIAKNGYKGDITLSKISLKPVSYAKEGRVDKTVKRTGLTDEEVDNLPTQQEFTVKTNYGLKEVNPDNPPSIYSFKKSGHRIYGDKKVILKRAGITVKTTGKDKYGVPSEFSASMVFRGKESYLETDHYMATAKYSGTLKNINPKHTVATTYESGSNSPVQRQNSDESERKRQNDRESTKTKQIVQNNEDSDSNVETIFNDSAVTTDGQEGEFTLAQKFIIGTGVLVLAGLSALLLWFIYKKKKRLLD